MTKSRKPGRANLGRGTCKCCQRRAPLNEDGRISSHRNSHGNCIGVNTIPVEGSVTAPRTPVTYS